MLWALVNNPLQPLQLRRLIAALAGHAVGSEIQVHEELGSTSDHARGLGMAGHPHGLAVFAESQNAGRGRRENRWSSQPGLDLAVSILLRPEARLELWPRFTTLAALATCKAMTAMWYAKRKGIPLERVETHVESDDSQERAAVYRMRVRVELFGPMSDAQRADVHRAIGGCPIHKLMTTSEVQIETVSP